MKIKEQTRKLAAGCSKQTVLRLWIELTVSNHTYGKATLTWFEEIFEEYNTNLEYKQPICSQEKGLDN
ncbi:chlorohydrolase [Streptococcus pneumoniae]|uniref:chlorohydrolase n=1 Tax=Streptococcus pneumoniae TaxID=1313 RepID=UPI000B32EAC0|nr:chlorohydrolase [Streptococcus pneumoniae]